MIEKAYQELEELVNQTNPNQPLIMMRAKQLIKLQEAENIGYDIDPLTEQAQALIERLKNEPRSN